MEKEKRYQRLRLGEMKKFNRDNKTTYQRSERESGYQMTSSLPILSNHHRHDPWVIWLRNKILFKELD